MKNKLLLLIVFFICFASSKHTQSAHLEEGEISEEGITTTLGKTMEINRLVTDLEKETISSFIYDKNEEAKITVDFITATHNDPNSQLEIIIRNHEDHALIRKVCSTTIFNGATIMFRALIGAPQLIYKNSISSLGSKSNYSIHTLKQDDIFLSVFNEQTKNSFIFCQNVMAFIYADRIAFLAFITDQLVHIRELTSSDHLDVTLISSYLSTGLQTLYNIINDLIPQHRSIHIDFSTFDANGSKKQYLIRTLDPPQLPSTISCPTLEEIAYYLSVTHYYDPSSIPNLGHSHKTVCFNKGDGSHRLLIPKEFDYDSLS